MPRPSKARRSSRPFPATGSSGGDKLLSLRWLRRLMVLSLASTAGIGPACPFKTISRRSLPRLAEIAQVGRQLILSGRHQQALRAQEIELLADADLRVVLAADEFGPVRPRSGVADISLVDSPRPRQGKVDHGNLVMQEVGIGLVERNPFLEDRLIVVVQREAGGIVDAGALERPARLDLEHVIAAVVVHIEPLANGVALVTGLALLRPVAAVGEDAAAVAHG